MNSYSISKKVIIFYEYKGTFVYIDGNIITLNESVSFILKNINKFTDKIIINNQKIKDTVNQLIKLGVLVERRER